MFVISYLALAVGLTVNACRKRSLAHAIPLLGYLVLQAGSALAVPLKSLLPFLNVSLLTMIAEYLEVIAPTLLLWATLVLSRSRLRARLLLIPPILVTGAALALDVRAFGPPGIVLADNARWVLSMLAWIVALGTAMVVAWRTRVLASSPLHRNRLRYWIGGLLLITAGDVIILLLPERIVSPQVGVGVRALGAALATVTWGIYYLPDVRVIVRRTLGYAILTLVTFAIYLAGIRLAHTAFPIAPDQEPLLGVVLVASVLALGYEPLRQGIQALTQRLMRSVEVDYAASLKEYSQRITHMLDLEPLAKIAVETVSTTLGVSRGALFIAQDNADGELLLEAVGGTGIQRREQLSCPPDSPIAQRWRSGGGSLLQYDIDVQPAFRRVSAAERGTLARWNMEILMPLRSMGQLVGVLALGSKQSRDPYFDSDLAYLTTLADETGVALHNARLFSDLRNANQEMESLNRDLEQANEQLQELDTLKSAFIGVITHELRSPFAALDFSMQLIQKYGLDNLLPEQREQLGQLAEGLRRAQTMINNLITFAAFLSKQGQLRMAPMDMRLLARETMATLEPIARKRAITMTLDLPDTLPTVRGDRERLAEALYHLLHNAIKFNRDGGSVTLRCYATPEEMIVEVSDTGIGIAPERLPDMWKDFTQIADPLRRGVEGLGLGLPLVRYVIRAHGGQVWARSEPGQGSTFGFRIPLDANVSSTDKP